MRILLVEDNPDIGDAIESKLREEAGEHYARFAVPGLNTLGCFSKLN